MVKLGKLTFRTLEETDHNALQKFCDECSLLGYENNSSFKNIKLEQMNMPFGKFFIGLDEDKIFNLAGVHHLPEVAPNAWRCLFRGAQLPGYSISNHLSKNIFLLGYQLSYILPLQMQFISKQFPDAEFYMSSNSPSNKIDTAGKSIRMDQLMRNTLLRSGVITEYASDFELYYTKQSIWKIDQERYWQKRSEVLPELVW